MATSRRALEEIIPTPREIVRREDSAKSYSRDAVYSIHVLGTETDQLAFAMSYLGRNLKERFGIHTIRSSQSEGLQDHDILICNDPALVQGAVGVALEPDFFATPNAREQGYAIDSGEGHPVLLCAASDQGCLYAVTTLLQLFTPAEDGVALESVRIRDYPEFRLRGNKWTIWCEIAVWSYDWGDGIGAFRQRIIEKLDMSLQYKINMLIFDGFGWDVAVFPEYASLMKELNREARLRGISLMHTGQSSGFCFRRNMTDTRIYRGEVLENREHYPDGEKYRCIGEDIYAGTCLSNRELIDRNLRSIRDFVQTVEPGSLYVHQLDVLDLPQSMWDSRCPRCRARWPNDRLDAEDGMAGAYAEYYGEVIAAIQEVRTPGYDAETDCLIMLISPGYLDAVAVDDEHWQLALRYWSKVSGLIENTANVFLGFREMFFNHDDGNRRIAELKAAIEGSGNGHRLGIIHFYGGDGWQSEHLFLPTPALNYVFSGADMLLTASGHAFQEPQQLFNAEFMWSPLHSPYRLDTEPENYRDFLDLYDTSRRGDLRPSRIYGAGGFLELACSKLYGDAAAAALAKVFALRGESGKPPIPYLRSTELHTTPGPDGALQPWIGFADRRESQELIEAKNTLHEMVRTTSEARDILDDVASHQDLESLRDFMAMGVEYIGYLAAYVEIYEKVVRPESIDHDLESEIQRLAQRVESAAAKNERSRQTPLDYMDGALSGRNIIVRFVRENLDLMSERIRRR